jgi:hypothetical protein
LPKVGVAINNGEGCAMFQVAVFDNPSLNPETGGRQAEINSVLSTALLIP